MHKIRRKYFALKLLNVSKRNQTAPTGPANDRSLIVQIIKEEFLCRFSVQALATSDTNGEQLNAFTSRCS